ncbi:MAG: hypothetical protein ACNI3A_02470 [Desulfovibrio sp.]|uniref:hypothetical protein n=1 Tax=Desulfovibrio sp. 7SRBS1 TaxID=3378064 RepID=UPI003B4090F3
MSEVYRSHTTPVAFIETEEQLSILEQKDRDEDILAVASSPMAMYLLEKGTRRHMVLNALFDDDSARRVCAGQYAKARSFCERVDQLSAEILEYDGPMERISSLSMMYFVMRAFASMLIRSRQVKAVLKHCRADHVVQINTPSLAPAMSSIPYVMGLTTALSPNIARELGLTTTVWGESAPRMQPPVQVASTARSAVKGSGPWLVIDEHSYEVGPVADVWEKETGGSVVLLDRVLASVPFQHSLDRSRELFHRLVSDEILIKGGDACYEVLEPMLAYFAYIHMPRQIAIAHNTNIFRVYTPGVMLVSSMASSTLESARAGGLPSAVFQHGGSGVQENPILDYIWRLGADTLLTYGPEVDRHFNSWEYDNGITENDNLARPYAVGSIKLHQLDAASPGEINSDADVMYINTTFGSDTSFFSHQYTDFWYWEFQQRILRTLAQKQGTNIIKVHPAEYVKSPLRAWLVDLNAGNCRVVDTPLTEVLDAAKAYVVDTLGTGILQLCLTTKPILALATENFFQFDGHALDLLEKRAELCRSPEEFAERIATFPDASSWDMTRLENRDFVNAYGYRQGTDPLEKTMKFLTAMAGKTAQEQFGMPCVVNGFGRDGG